jgi:uncharacterized protein YecE (DUF72 family)
MAGTLRVGTSGWVYRDWRERFYPRRLAVRAWFAHYAMHFDTVEVNNTFYRLPAAGTFVSWAAAAPRGFTFAVKFSRYGSHLRRLRTPRSTIGRFLRRAERLGPHLGPILVQLPPRWGADPERLDAFLAAAPRRHRWAVEFRDPSWLRPAVYRVLARHGAALCLHDHIDDHPPEVTAPWLYFRFHGGGRHGPYGAEGLRPYVGRIRALLRDGLDVFAYFNNDAEGRAIVDALRLRRALSAWATRPGRAAARRDDPRAARRGAARRTPPPPSRRSVARTAGSTPASRGRRARARAARR